MKTNNTDAPILLQENTSKIEKLHSYLRDIVRHVNDVLDQYSQLDGNLNAEAPLKLTDLSQLSSNTEAVIRRKFQQKLKPNELRVGQLELNPEKVASLITLPNLTSLCNSAIELSELIGSIKSDSLLGRISPLFFIELTDSKAVVVAEKVSSFVDENLKTFARTKEQIALYNAAQQIASILNEVVIPVNRGKIYKSDWGFNIDFDLLLKKLLTVKCDKRNVSITEAKPEVVIDPTYVKSY